MTLNKLILAGGVCLLFSQCDPTKKAVSSDDYTGTIDTSYTDSYDYGEYDYGDYDYGDEYYYDESYVDDASADVSPWSQDVYRSSATRSHDLLHTALDVRFDWANAWLLGKASLTLKPYFYPSRTLVLDAKGMDIHQVAMVNKGAKTNLNWTYDSLQITIDLGREYTKDEQYTVYIDYTARPEDRPEGGSFAITSDKGLYFINRDGSVADKPQQIWTQGETEASSVWFPTIDKPNERTTDEIYITVDKKFATLSNGLLTDSHLNNDGTRTDHWVMDMPHAPYLFMMAVGEFTIVKDKWKNKEVNYYVEPAYAPYARAIFGNTPEMMTFYSNVLGVDYPWQKYSQVVVRDYVSGAMENTTATLHGDFLQQTDRELLDETWEDVISHELFHQWFGDLVTTESWSNLPLNESFATYGEYLWREYKYGREDADEHLKGDYDSYMTEAESKQVDMIRFNYEDKEDMFDSHSYAKGGCILHMLRKYVGDDAFFASLKLYLEDNKFQAVEIHNLRLAFEEVTGEDLNWFFNQWFLNSGHPDLTIEKEFYEDLGLLEIRVTQNQIQPTPTYVLPVDIDIYTGDQVERHRIIIDKRDQTFTFEMGAAPDAVIFDAENQLLAQISEEKPSEEWSFQFHHSQMYLDRLKALYNLEFQQDYSEQATEVYTAALQDMFWGIRSYAVESISLENNWDGPVADIILNMAQHDPKASVRASAIGRLESLGADKAIPVLKAALNDSSYAVIGNALSVLSILDPSAALEGARRYQNEKNINVLAPVWGILAEEGNPIDNDYFLHMFDTYTSWEVYYLMVYYQLYLQNQTDISIIQKGVDQFKEIALDEDGGWFKFFAGSFLNGIYEYYAENMDYQDDTTKQAWQAGMTYIEETLSAINGMWSDEEY